MRYHTLLYVAHWAAKLREVKGESKNISPSSNKTGSELTEKEKMKQMIEKEIEIVQQLELLCTLANDTILQETLSQATKEYLNKICRFYSDLKEKNSDHQEDENATRCSNSVDIAELIVSSLCEKMISKSVC